MTEGVLNGQLFIRKNLKNVENTLTDRTAKAREMGSERERESDE